MERPTGEDLFADDDFDYIPGATIFFKPDDSGDKPLSLAEGLPNNPEDYLRSVREEAKQCPDVVTASIDEKKIKKKGTVSNGFHNSLPGSEYAPTKAWCNQQVKSFAQARQEYIRHLAQLKSINKQSKRRPKLPIYPLPAWDDETNWRYFCLGNKMVPISNDSLDNLDNIILDGKAKDDLSEALAAISSTTTTTSETQEVAEDGDRIIDLSTLEEGFPPLLRILLRMEAKQVQSNLAFQVEWLKSFGFSDHQGRWIYALMTCLEKPLYPTVISTLRDLSRECAKLRTLVEPDSMEMNGLNLIICVVGNYFDQMDLLDRM